MKTVVIDRNKLLATGVAVLLLAALALPIRAAAMKPTFAAAAKPGDQTIAEIAVGNGNFTTLVAALSCTGLVPAVSADKQLTVFAPTDAAFAKLSLDASNVCSTPDLSTILLYHVINGRQTSNSVMARSSYMTLSGDRLTRTQLGDAGIVATDISARNGIVHVIDSVLLP